MIKKIISISLLVLLSAFLIFGAINRTARKDLLGTSKADTNREETKNGNGYGNQKDDENWLESIFKINQSDTSNNKGNNGHGRENEDYSEGHLENGPDLTPSLNWTDLDGSISIIEEGYIEILCSNGETIAFGGRPYSFAIDSGFSASTGDSVILTGFRENGAFEIVQIENLENNVITTIRDEYGKPLWSGRNRGNEKN